MTTLTETTAAHPSPLHTRPRPLRRAGIAVTGLISLLLPTSFGVSSAVALLTGAETSHRFHQATGQGMLLSTIWIGTLLPLIVGGWQGRRPSTAAGLAHVLFVLAGALVAIAAPGAGAAVLVAVIAVPSSLLWLALPSRPRLGARFQIDPVLTPVALAAAALYTPYAVAQVVLQNGATGLHAENPHHFDVAWVATTLVLLALAAGLFPAVRSLMAWVAGASVVLGVAGLAFGEGVTTSVLMLVLGIVAGVALRWRNRLGSVR